MLVTKLPNGLYQASTFGYHAKPIAETRDRVIESMLGIIAYWRNLEAHRGFK